MARCWRVGPHAVLAGLGFVLVGGPAQAQSIIPVISGYTPTTVSATTEVQAAQQETVQTEAVLQPSMGLVVSATQRAIAAAVSRVRLGWTPRLASLGVQYAALDPTGALLAADESTEGGWSYAAWANIQNSWAESTASAASWDGTITLPLVGMDASSDEWLGIPLVLGISAGYQRTSLTTSYNAGSLTGNGATVSPYFALVPTDNIYLEGSLGYSSTSYDLEDASSGSLSLASLQGDRVFGFLYLNGRVPQDWHGDKALTIGGKIGFSYATEFFSGYTDSQGFDYRDTRSQLGQASIGASIRYLFELEDFALEPYVDAVFGYDVVRTGGDVPGLSTGTEDTTDVVLGIGTDLLVGDRFTITIEYNTTLARDDYSNHTGLLLARAKF